MTSIKIFKNHDSQNLENDVNKFLQGYENYLTSVSLMTFIKDSSPIFLAVVTILEEKIPPVNVETADTK
ncbi:MAG: hypothetical protein E6K97_07580 [Thaumarchaeota archaeon]|nr:MAG: hypothetical protein E6K97_07580 [Nitrososphaerota archaeon]